jgi:hypothetical protein
VGQSATINLLPISPGHDAETPGYDPEIGGQLPKRSVTIGRNLHFVLKTPDTPRRSSEQLI